ncbi:hypothetical protein ACWEPC_58035, partial [Nonomuraea sp. NPDC004297]
VDVVVGEPVQEQERTAQVRGVGDDRAAVSEALVLRSGKTYTALSARGEPPTLSGKVMAMLHRIPKWRQSKGHGSCGLAICVSKAIDDGEDVLGADAAAVLVRSSNSHPWHGTPIGPCSSCESLVDELDLNFFR